MEPRFVTRPDTRDHAHHVRGRDDDAVIEHARLDADQGDNAADAGHYTETRTAAAIKMRCQAGI